MTARYRVEHRSVYRYDHPVTASFNEARLTPAATAGQIPLESQLRVDQATWQHRYVDYWGTQVRVFEARTPHHELVVDATSTVEVDARLRPRPDTGLDWAALSTPDVLDRQAEYLTPTPSSRPPDDLAELAQGLVAGRTPHEAALAISSTVHDTMTYQPGSTGVQTPAAEAWAARNGVCQDYAHLVVGALRHVGIPARYVSGYLHPKADVVIGSPASGESHAWVEWWLGEWAGYDPTNDADVAERHVLIGHGRDYRDIPPIKGIVAGTPANTRLEVDVTITRLA